MIYEALLITSEIHSKNKELDKLEQNIKEIIKVKPDLPKKFSLNYFIILENFKYLLKIIKKLQKLLPKLKILIQITKN